MRIKRISLKFAVFSFLLGVSVSFTYGVFLHIFEHLRAETLAKDNLVQKLESLAYTLPETLSETLDAESLLEEYARALRADYIFMIAENGAKIQISAGEDAEALGKIISDRLKSGYEESIAEGAVKRGRTYLISYRRIWQSSDIYAGIAMNKYLFNKSVTANFIPLIAILFIFPVFLGILGYFLGRMLERPIDVLAANLRNLSEGTPAALEGGSAEVMKEIEQIKEKVLKAHGEYNLIKERYEEKKRNFEQIKRELEQNAHNRAALLESNLENIKVALRGEVSELAMVERNFMYQTGYAIGGNLIDEALLGIKARSGEIIEDLTRGGVGLLNAAENANDLIRYLEKLRFFFEPLYVMEFYDLETAVEDARNLIKKFLKHRNVEASSYIAEGFERAQVNREFVRISAAAVCLLFAAAGEPKEPEIIIDVSEGDGASEVAISFTIAPKGKQRAAPRRENQCSAGELSSALNDNSKIANLADALPLVTRMVLKGDFLLYKSADAWEVEIRINI
jgi:hypothetical protein